MSQLLERGLSQQASRLARFLSLRRLGPPATLLAGRLAPALGGARLGSALVLRAARRDPDWGVARYHAARVVLFRHGPIVAWMRMRAWGVDLGSDAPKDLQAAWLALHATLVGSFRDFESAEAFLRAAERLSPGEPSVRIAQASVLIERDRRVEALDAAQEARRQKPWDPEALLTAAHVLLTLGRGVEACDLLLQGATITEDSRVLRQLTAHLAEQRRFVECLEWLDRFEAASPLLDHEGRGFLAWMRSSARDALGESRRVLLPVPFVQQDRYTCSPATLAELAAFWGRPVDPVAVADAIAYHGTPRHRARAWAEEHGWVVREFKVTWQSARAVLDRGVPFAMVTRWGMGGHDQAVVGYDAERMNLLIRCPSRPFLVELPAHELATQAWCGPRGTILLPEPETSRLDGLELPDVAAYDHLHALEVALCEHRRDEAGAIATKMARVEPGNRQNLWATLELAQYDSDHASVMLCVEALLEAFPGTPALELWRLHALRHLASPSAYARMLFASCRRYPRDPGLQSLLALQLSQVPGQAQRASSVLRPVLRRGDWSAATLNLCTLANVREAEGGLEEARLLIEIAAHLGDMQEWLAATYFAAARARGRTDEALQFLRARYDAYGRLSGDPAQTLFAALCEAGDAGAALSMLTEALSLRPCDDDLRLFAAKAYATAGDHDGAETLLAETRGRTHRAQWLRAAAAIACCRGDQVGSLRLWREVLAVEPAAVDAHQAVADLLTTLGQPSAADAHLRSARSRFPRHYALAQLGLAGGEFLLQQARQELVDDRAGDRFLVDAEAVLGRGGKRGYDRPLGCLPGGVPLPRAAATARIAAKSSGFAVPCATSLTPLGQTRLAMRTSRPCERSWRREWADSRSWGRLDASGAVRPLAPSCDAVSSAARPTSTTIWRRNSTEPAFALALNPGSVMPPPDCNTLAKQSRRGEGPSRRIINASV